MTSENESNNAGGRKQVYERWFLGDGDGVSDFDAASVADESACRDIIDSEFGDRTQSARATLATELHQALSDRVISILSEEFENPGTTEEEEFPTPGQIQASVHTALANIDSIELRQGSVSINLKKHRSKLAILSSARKMVGQWFADWQSGVVKERTLSEASKTYETYLAQQAVFNDKTTVIADLEEAIKMHEAMEVPLDPLHYVALFRRFGEVYAEELRTDSFDPDLLNKVFRFIRNGIEESLEQMEPRVPLGPKAIESCFEVIGKIRPGNSRFVEANKVPRTFTDMLAQHMRDTSVPFTLEQLSHILDHLGKLDYHSVTPEVFDILRQLIARMGQDKRVSFNLCCEAASGMDGTIATRGYWRSVIDDLDGGAKLNPERRNRALFALSHSNDDSAHNLLPKVEELWDVHDQDTLQEAYTIEDALYGLNNLTPKVVQRSLLEKKLLPQIQRLYRKEKKSVTLADFSRAVFGIQNLTPDQVPKDFFQVYFTALTADVRATRHKDPLLLSNLLYGMQNFAGAYDIADTIIKSGFNWLEEAVSNGGLDDNKDLINSIVQIYMLYGKKLPDPVQEKYNAFGYRKLSKVEFKRAKEILDAIGIEESKAGFGWKLDDEELAGFECDVVYTHASGVKVNLEIDGPDHPHKSTRDARRDELFRSKGVAVVRTGYGDSLETLSSQIDTAVTLVGSGDEEKQSIRAFQKKTAPKKEAVDLKTMSVGEASKHLLEHYFKYKRQETFGSLLIEEIGQHLVDTKNCFSYFAEKERGHHVPKNWIPPEWKGMTKGLEQQPWKRMYEELCCANVDQMRSVIRYLNVHVDGSILKQPFAKPKLAELTKVVNNRYFFEYDSRNGEDLPLDESIFTGLFAQDATRSETALKALQKNESAMRMIMLSILNVWHEIYARETGFEF